MIAPSEGLVDVVNDILPLLSHILRVLELFKPLAQPEVALRVTDELFTEL